MEKIKAIIVEDELEGMNNLVIKIEKSCPDIDIVGKCENGKDAIGTIDQLNPDLVFLDVRLGNMTGFDVLNRLPHIHFEVIFTTAYDEYAIQALKLNAIDYLLKPIKLKELESAVDKVRVQLHSQGVVKRIAVPNSNGLRFVPIDDILYCKADNNYAEIYLQSEDIIHVSKPLKYVSQRLPKDIFLRIGRSVIINLNAVKSYSRTGGGQVFLNDDTELSITQNKDDFLRRMSKL